MKSDSAIRKGVSILAGGLAFVGTADATELIIDGSFENTEASSNPIVRVGGKPNPGIGGTMTAPRFTIDAGAAVRRGLRNEVQRRLKDVFGTIVPAPPD